MPAYESNITHWIDGMRRYAQGVGWEDLTIDGVPVAEVIQDTVADVTLDRVKREVGPDGGRWAELHPRWELWKIQHGFPADKAVQTGDMTNRWQFVGQKPAVLGPILELRYGVTEFARRKLRWFHFGTRRQPARPLIGWDRKMEDAVWKNIHDALYQLAMRVMGG